MNSASYTVECDHLDCYNEDLVWIVDRLVSRSGGRFGLITRHVEGENPMVLAQTTEMPPGSDSLLGPLANEAASAASTDRGRRDDAVCMRERSWIAPFGDTKGQDFRLLQLAFAPTHNVSLVASVCKPGESAPYQQLELLTASKLYPVLSRYVRLWWLHRMERRRANSLSAALDLSDVGVILLDRQASLLFTNARAMAILEQQDGLRRDSDSVVATASSADLRLQAAVHHALHRNRGRTQEHLLGPDGAELPVLPLPRATHRRALLASVMNVRHAAVDLRDPAVIIYVFDPECDLEQALLPICRLYKLTGAEVRLVHHLMGGLRINQAAEHMGIQPDTARAYLKQVFSKTGTNRQVDLARLMLTSMLRTNVDIDIGVTSVG